MVGTATVFDIEIREPVAKLLHFQRPLDRGSTNENESGDRCFSDRARTRR